MNRFERLREDIGIAGGRGLEIGPLTSPVVPRDLGEVYYVDHATTDELRAKYAGDPAVDESRIVPIDFVWGEHTLLELVGSAAPFDYVVASHVLEHVPDLVGWLKEVAGVLRPGGRLSLALPDGRYTFDVRRRDSDVSEVVEAHLLGLRRPSVRATFDHFYRFVEVDTAALWRGLPGHGDPPPDTETALSFARAAATTGCYIDTHCWVFSDASFVELMGTLITMGLVDLSFVAFSRTHVGDIEFFVTLERLAAGLSPEERRERCLASLPVLPPAASTPSTNGVAALGELTLSGKERALIEVKRRVMAGIRSVAGRRPGR